MLLLKKKFTPFLLVLFQPIENRFQVKSFSKHVTNKIHSVFFPVILLLSKKYALQNASLYYFFVSDCCRCDYQHFFVVVES